jgi:hypothetical protein
MQREAHIKTFGEIFPASMIELVSCGPSQVRCQLLLWDGTKAHLVTSVRSEPAADSGFGATIFEPPEIDSTILRAIRFPTHAAPYSSSCELFVEVFGLIQEYTGLPEKLCRLLTYCVFASWFSDRTPIQICISIIGPESRQGWQLFRLLSCLFRRALPLSDANLSGLCSLPNGLFPALFLEQRELSTQSEKVLCALHGRDTFIPWRGRLVNLGWAKVIRSEEPLSNFALGVGAIEIPVDPGCCSFPMLDLWIQRKIANRFQPMLLMYRLNNMSRITNSLIDFPDFAPPVREVACCLTDCMPDMPDVQAEMTSLLEERNRQVQSECETDPNSIVLEAMLSFCHQENKKSVRVAEVASAVNAILEQDGELFELSAKAAGGKLKLLGLYTKRIDAKNRGLLLTDAARHLIHKLAWDCGVDETRDVQSCTYCKHFAKVEEESKQPFVPGKGLLLSVQPQGDQPQPVVQPNIGQPPSVDQGEDMRSPRWIENEDDQKLVDKLKKEAEL